jgi:hypothetical protein
MSVESMTPERFIDLASAFGGDIDRWPAEAQGPARARLQSDPHLALVLGEAGAVDAFLATSPEPAFSGVLREQLIAGAPHRATLANARRWFAGAGLAAACAVGVVFGSQFSDRLIGSPASVATSAEAVTQPTTSFDGGQTDILGLEEAG